MQWIGFFIGSFLTALIQGIFGSYQALLVLMGGALGVLYARTIKLQEEISALQRARALSTPAPRWPEHTASVASRAAEQLVPDAVEIPDAVPLAPFAQRLAEHAAVASTDARTPEFAQARDNAATDVQETLAPHLTAKPAAPATPPPLERRPHTRPTSEPGIPPMPQLQLPTWLQGLLSFENWPIKLGVLLLLIGLGSAYRYLEAQGYLRLPISYRLVSIALLALAALAFGWAQRIERRSFALSVQGGALGALLITIYAAMQQYNLIGGTLAFSLMVAVVAIGVTLALLQNSLWLALFAALGGFLAPVLASTGSGQHVALFGYYLVLNLGILTIALRKGWRALNVLGAVATFGIGLLWGARMYRPENFATVEPFLLAFFLIYLAITVLYALRHGEGEAVFDAPLVFGVPLATLTAQWGMLYDNRPAIGWFCVVTAVVYVLLRRYLQKRDTAPLLQQCFLVLALSFATLAIPLLFNARMTAVLWALEGAAAIWLGLQQGRRAPVLIGYALQVYAGYYFMDQFRFGSGTSYLNVQYAGAMVIAAAGWISSYCLDQRQRFMEAALLLVWGSAWWLLGNFVNIVEHAPHRFVLALLLTFVAATVMLTAWLQETLRWPRWAWLAQLGIFSLPCWVLSVAFYDSPLGDARGLGLALLFVASLYALHMLRGDRSRDALPLSAISHALVLLSAALLISVVLYQRLPNSAGEGLRYAIVVLPFLALAWACYRPLEAVGWPLVADFKNWSRRLMHLLVTLSCVACFIACFSMGNPVPMRFVPLLNPLEITQILSLLLLWRVLPAQATLALSADAERIDIVRRAAFLLGFLVFSAIALRLSNYAFADARSMAHAFASQAGQATLSIVWSLLGCGAMLMGHARARRALWVAGASLMGLVLLKLLLIDRQHLGDLPGIIATLGVGGLLAAVGYFAPAPPANAPPQMHK